MSIHCQVTEAGYLREAAVAVTMIARRVACQTPRPFPRILQDHVSCPLPITSSLWTVLRQWRSGVAQGYTPRTHHYRENACIFRELERERDCGVDRYSNTCV
jgi:hypothetical protein